MVIYLEHKCSFLKMVWAIFVGGRMQELELCKFGSNGMSSIAMGIYVGFLKQPALSGEAPQKKILQKK
jgi:hypothetical protein